jgi:hypothetical protein
VGCYPVEAVTKFELKATEAEGWVEQTGVDCVVRQGGVVSLTWPLAFMPPGLCVGPRVGRVTYTGGYVLPGGTPTGNQVALPDDLERACIEQVAVWFQQRDKLGLIRHWPSGGIYMVFVQTPLLPMVEAVLRYYRRYLV